MRTVRRMLAHDILLSIGFVALAFLALFFFIDFVDELSSVGQSSYTTLLALVYCLLELPSHLYQLAPIAILIGTIYSLSRLAQSSEFTVLRTAGLSPARALYILGAIGFFLSILTFLIGDFVAPFGQQVASNLRSAVTNNRQLDVSRTWLKDSQQTAQGEYSYAIQIGQIKSPTKLQQVKIFQFDEASRLIRRIVAQQATIESFTWLLQGVSITQWTPQSIIESKLDSYSWLSNLSPSIVAAAVKPIKTSSTLELLRYINHLSDNEQAAQRHSIQFWSRAFYPFACLVMMALALPFAYLHTRQTGISLKVFGGIMLGIGFILFNNLIMHVGLLKNWTPWIVALSPSLFFLVLSISAFGFLVRLR